MKWLLIEELTSAKLKKPIEELAGGRVFTGAQAVELGLVDEIGGLRDAIVKAAELAHFKEGAYSLRVLPESVGFWQAFFEAMRGEESGSSDLAAAIAPRSARASLDALRGSGATLGPGAAVLEKLAPTESRALEKALVAAKLLRKERVIALMPELSFGN